MSFVDLDRVYLIMTYIINGKKLAAEREKLLKIEVQRLTKKIGRKPKLVAVELADDEGSRLYLKLKRNEAERIGIEMEVYETSSIESIGFRKLHWFDTDGIFVQHPRGYDKQKWQELVDQIPPEKDVDCLTSKNLRLIKEGKPWFLPATVKAVLYCLETLKRSDLAVPASPAGGRQGRTLLKYVILGRSPMVGLPLFWWLKSLGTEVILLHSQSKNKKQKTKTADILISSVGKPGIVTADMVKSGVIIIDCGSPVGDIDFDSVSRKAAAITPVPGGVGPLTVVSLMENVVKSAKDIYAKKR